MKIVTNCFASVVFVSLIGSLCSDAHAQSESRGGYAAPLTTVDVPDPCVA